MKARQIVMALVMGLFVAMAASADDAEVLRGRFAGAFTGAVPPEPVALFDGVLRVDDEKLPFDGESFVGVFPDGTSCGSPLGLCSVWTTDEGSIFNQTDSFDPAPDNSFTQELSFVGGTGEFEGVSGVARVAGTLDGVGGFEGKIRGVLFEGDDDEDDDD